MEEECIAGKKKEPGMGDKPIPGSLHNIDWMFQVT
jgi:hypothetical protein